MSTLLFIIQIIAHIGTVYLLFSYTPSRGARYRPFVSLISVVLAGASLALTFGMLLAQPWAHSYSLTLLAVIVYVALLRCHGNVAKMVKR